MVFINHIEPVTVLLLTRKQVFMYEAMCVGFTSLEVSKFHIYEAYYDNMQPYFGQQILQLRYLYTDKMILTMKTENIINDFKNSDDIFDFSNLDENHEYLVRKTKK